MEKAEVVLGTYENLILGYRVVSNLRKDSSPFGLELGFTEDAHRGALRCMAVSANGILASSSTDDSVRLHSLRRRKEIGGLFEHNGTVNSLTFFEKSYMFSASDDGKICMWKTKNWELLKALKGHKSHVLSVAIHPSGKLALSVGQDKSLLTWDLVTGKLAFQRKIKEAAQKIMFTASGDHYVLVYQRSIEVCSIQDTKVVKETELNWRINACCHIQDDIYGVGGDDRHVFLIDIVTGNKLLTLDMAESGQEANFSGRVRCICAVRGGEAGSLVFVGMSTGTVKAFSVDLTEDEELSEELMSYDANVRMTCMAVYIPSTPQDKENVVKNGQTVPEQTEEEGGEEEEIDGDVGEEEENEESEEESEIEEEEEEEEELKPAPAKRRKIEAKEQKKQKAKGKVKSPLPSPATPSEKQKKKSPGKKGKKKKGKVKAK